MTALDNAVTGPLEAYLDLVAEREKIIVGNMANSETPNYRTRDLDFEAELQRVADQMNGEITVPPGSDIGDIELRAVSFETGAQPAFEDPSARVVEVRGLIERPDGNNVSVEREGILLAQTQLQFKMGSELLKHRLQALMQVITEGNQTQ
jgi:flagellar basal-body rod protein FlgB